MRDQVCRRSCHIGLAYNEADNNLAALIVLRTYNGRCLDCRVLHQHILDLGRRDVDAGAFYHLRMTTKKSNVTSIGQLADIASSIPAVVCERFCIMGRAFPAIAAHDITRDFDLARFAIRHFLTGFAVD